MTVWQNLGIILAVLASALGVIAAFCAASIRAYRFAAKFGRTIDQILGYGEGAARVPGLVERVQRMQAELHELKREVQPNGGSSLRDAIDRLDQRLDEYIALDTKRSEGP